MPKICNVEDCTYPVWGKGYCKSHQHLRTDKNKPKKPKVTSDKMVKNLAVYRVLRDKYLKDNPVCYRCGTNVNLTLHHMKGRLGGLLTDVSYYMTLCIPCHRWVTDYSKEAKVLGLSFDRSDK